MDNGPNQPILIQDDGPATPVRRRPAPSSNTFGSHFCFTWNNPTMDSDALIAHFATFGRIRGAIFQLEAGSEGTDHYQGYLEFKRSHRFSFLKRLIPEAHWEPRYGTRRQAFDYCRKEDSRKAGPWQMGEFPTLDSPGSGSGRRSDLLDFAKGITATNIRAKALERPDVYLRYSSGMDRLALLQRPERDSVKVTLHYGLPGTGKTRKAVEDSKNDYWVMPPTDGFWFDGYMGEGVAILDDFSGRSSKVSLSHLLQILDRYTVPVPVKGSFTWWVPKHIIVTTNLHPNQWYDYSSREVHYRALKRRFTNVLYFDKPGEDPEEIDIDQFFTHERIIPIPRPTISVNSEEDSDLMPSEEEDGLPATLYQPSQ